MAYLNKGWSTFSKQDEMTVFNSLSPLTRFKSMVFKPTIENSNLSTFCEIDYTRMPLYDLTYEESTLVQVMACCRQVMACCRNKPLSGPMLTQIYVCIWRHYVNKLTSTIQRNLYRGKSSSSITVKFLLWYIQQIISLKYILTFDAEALLLLPISRGNEELLSFYSITGIVSLFSKFPDRSKELTIEYFIGSYIEVHSTPTAVVTEQDQW